MTDTFTWRVNMDSSGGGEFAMSTAKFGDGYVQEVPNGINNETQKWSVTVSGKKTLMQTVLAFIRTHKGQSFFWTPPLGVEGYYKCKRYNPVDRGGGWWELNMEFEQSYSP